LKQRSVDQAVHELSINKVCVLQKLVEIAEKCTTNEHYAPSAANKSLELIGREIGMFRDSIPMETFQAINRALALVVLKYVADQQILDRIVGDFRIDAGQFFDTAITAIRFGPDHHEPAKCIRKR
jgi:hypothetical protein